MKRRTNGVQQVLACLCLAIGCGAAAAVEISENLCSGKHGVFLPKAGSCNEYFICIEGQPVLGSCGNNHFDARQSACVDPSKAECASSSPTLRPLLPPCSGKRNGARVAVEHDPRQYYLCMNNRPFLKSCGDMFFNAKTSSCSLGRDLPAEKQLVPASLLIEVGLPGKRLPLRVCQDQSVGARIAIPGTCSQYYVCMGNSGIPRSCGHMQFNPAIAACDLASSVNCRIQEGVAVYESPASETQPSKEVTVCQGKPDATFVPAADDCSKYYFCYQNAAIPKSCGSRHFSPVTMSCVNLQASTCVVSSPLAQNTVAVSAPNTSVADCASRDSGVLLKHPSDCGKYVICDNHKAVEMACPAGLHFNVRQSYCDWPELAQCS